TGRGAWTLRIDIPFQETVRRDGGVRGLLPVVWSNDFGGVTVGLRERANYLGRYDRGLVLGTVATRPGASQALGVYGRWSNPIGGLTPRTTTTLAGWLTEGRAGAAIRADRSLRQHLGFGADPHVGFDALWMATTDLGYLDRRLWYDAGTIEAGPWGATTARRGAAVLRARLGGRGGVVYFNPGRGAVSRNRYDFEAFGRVTGEASVRTPLLGARVFAGAYLGQSDPVRQRQISFAGADPYETFTNPLLRSRGALLVRPDFHYQAPGGANLRGFRPDLGGRWAVGVNLEITPWVLRRDQGILGGLGLEAFVDAGVVDTLMIRSSSPRAATSGRRARRRSSPSSPPARAAATASRCARCTRSSRRRPGPAWLPARRSSIRPSRRASPAPTCRAPAPARRARSSLPRTAGRACTWGSWSSTPSAVSRSTACRAGCARALALWGSERSRSTPAGIRC